MCIATASEPATASVLSSPCTEILEVVSQRLLPPRRRRGPTATSPRPRCRVSTPVSAQNRHPAMPRLPTTLAAYPDHAMRPADTPQQASHGRHATPRLTVPALAAASRARWPCVDWTRLRPHSALGLHVSAMVQQQLHNIDTAFSSCQYQRRIATLRCHYSQRRSQLTPITPCDLQTRRSEPATPRHA